MNFKLTTGIKSSTTPPLEAFGNTLVRSIEPDPTTTSRGGRHRPMSTTTLKSAPNEPEFQHASGPSEIAVFQNGGLFEREDWTLFRSLTTLPQKAGVPLNDIPGLVCKELADNAMDASGDCRVGLLEGENGFFVEDDGAGIAGTDEEIARLFSIRRPLASSKLIRLPTRGALGNGLRVVAGTVLASRGRLTVTTRGRTLELTPRDDGGTGYEVVGQGPLKGVRVEARFGPPFEIYAGDLYLARQSINLARYGGPRYQGKTSPHWYEADGFWELCQAGGSRTVRELIAEFFDGCSEPSAGKIASVVSPGRLARELSREQATKILAAAKARAKPVNPKRLGCVGSKVFPGWAYAKEVGELTTSTGITAPVVIEAWANGVVDDRSADYSVFVNRTMVACDTQAHIEKSEHTRLVVLWGCAADIEVKIGRLPVCVVINIDTPYMPITSDGKTPDIRGLASLIGKAASKAINKLRRSACSSDRPSQKELIVEAIPDAAAKMSDNGTMRFSQRQLFYAVREEVKKQMPASEDGEPFELKWEYFCQVVTGHEADRGDIPNMTRDPRGTLYHPHTREEIPLGTIAVENYSPPKWTFNKLLYCEKEGFIEILKAVGWPERNDCALVSSKGYATRAVRDVFDLLGETDEEIAFFCVHDADAYGTMILQSLREATKARAARKVEVINLGLDPEEALAMGLEAEPVSGDKTKSVAKYLTPEWAKWLQANRVELNAMSTRQFLAWLDSKVAPYAGKVIPPADVMADRLTNDVSESLRGIFTTKALEEAGIEAKVEQAVKERIEFIDEAVATITDDVTDALNSVSVDPWTAPVGRIAEVIAKADPSGSQPG